ncbi:MAG: phosphoenolpyruvate--protein phosphotransferase [Thermoanaerobaculia bacterium]
MGGRPMQVVVGFAAAHGVAIGRAVVIANRALDVFRLPLSEGEIPTELDRFRAACRATQQQIHQTRVQAGELFGQDLAAIFDAHSLLLSDRTFVSEVERHIETDHVNAEWAVHETTRELRRRFSDLETDYLRERGEDLEDVGRQLLRTLQGLAHRDITEVEGDVILIADDLVPSEAIRLARQKVLGFAIEAGGRTSHTTIIARSLGLPAVTGLEEVTDLVTDEDPVIIDGIEGRVILHPTPETLERYRRLQLEFEGNRALAFESRDEVARSADDVAVEFMANIDLPDELADHLRVGARGIGLYRSEFLYMETDPRLPEEEDHLRIYRELLASAAPHPVVVRTYDLGGKKLAREMMESEEDNPVLGLRGIRLTLARPQIFRTQIRALLRAAIEGDLWVMAPMVSRYDEVDALREVFAGAAKELRDEGLAHREDIRLGIMIEVPAAAMIADSLAQAVDFLAIGTNDLIQYSLAADRNNKSVAHLYDPFHPAILRMLRFVIASADGAGKPVSLCGEMGGDPDALRLLLGLGLRRVSASPRAIPALRRRLSEIDVSRAGELARKACEARTSREVLQILREGGESS